MYLISKKGQTNSSAVWLPLCKGFSQIANKL
jgi:hypothetical protein